MTYKTTLTENECKYIAQKAGLPQEFSYLIADIIDVWRIYSHEKSRGLWVAHKIEHPEIYEKMAEEEQDGEY